jgi:cytosine/adenosine deaminase-related metal-dependent hydrolase
MAGQLPPLSSFTDWLKLITETKAGWNRSDYAESWQAGARMLVRNGVTTVADVEAVPELLPDCWKATPLRIISFLELIGITQRRAPDLLIKQALAKRKAVENKRCKIGLSPHAPYSTTPELLRLCGKTAQCEAVRVSTHVAESAVEYEMFTRGSGEMHDWLRRSGRDVSDCGRCSPVRHLERCGLLGSFLVGVHANYLAQDDPGLLARRRVSVVHCPRSHAYFRHRRFPLRRLVRAGVNVCLGTDSLATVYRKAKETVELSMFEEMRALAESCSFLSPGRILRMATVNGARALGMEGEIGELRPGAWADLIAVSFAGASRKVLEGVLEHRGPVQASMIAGQWAVTPEGSRADEGV